MRKTPSDHKDQYNPGLHELIQGGIAYDKKMYKALDDYITKRLWKHMDKDWVQKVVFVLDDPLKEYEDDIVLTKKLLRSFLPKLKQSLRIDAMHPITPYFDDNISLLRSQYHIIDRLITQQLNLYRKTRNTSGSLTKVFQSGPIKKHIDGEKSLTKELIVDNVPPLQKSIIANILTLMILEEELQKAKTAKE